MKKNISILAITVVASIVSIPRAQAQEAVGVKIGVEGAFVLPMSNWSDVAGIGLGGMAKGSYFLNDSMSLSLRAGYIYHLPKTIGGVDYSTAELPILFGFRYQLPIGLYGDIATGLVNNTAKAGDLSASEMKMGLMAGAGYTTLGFSIGANLFIPSIGDAGDVLGILFLVGYNFFSF